MEWKSEVKAYPNCFGCGDENPIGLGLNYRTEGVYLTTEFVPREEHQGWPGIVHGGIITSLLYEVLENHPFHQGDVAMMKSMETRFRRPGHTGDAIEARSWVLERSGREIKVAASLTRNHGELIAEGTAVMVVLDDTRAKRLGIT